MILSLLYCCSPSKKVVNNAQTKFTKEDLTDGSILISKSDCLICHTETKRNIGPSWNEIAEKYQNAADSVINKLANKILIGGFGPWGYTPMAPHPNHNSETAVVMVKYILQTKNK